MSGCREGGDRGGADCSRVEAAVWRTDQPALTARASQHPAHELRGRSIAMGLIGPIAIRPRQFDALVVGRPFVVAANVAQPASGL